MLSKALRYNLGVIYCSGKSIIERGEKVLLKPVQVAEFLNISKSKVYAMIKHNKIPFVYLDGCLRVPEEELKDWIKQKTFNRN